jgi:hypothetical protein
MLELYDPSLGGGRCFGWAGGDGGMGGFQTCGLPHNVCATEQSVRVLAPDVSPWSQGGAGRVTNARKGIALAHGKQPLGGAGSPTTGHTEGH